MKVILLAIVTIAIIHKTKAHNHWKPSEDCLYGRTEPWKCCLASEATIYLKHPKYCNQYFKCSYKHLTLKRCHLGHHWSVQHQKCKKPKEAQCENISATTTTLKPATTTTTKPSQWQLPEGCYDGTVSVTECCKMSQRWYELLPDQNNCRKFYKCYKGKSYHLSCPLFLKWSDEKQKCVYSRHTDCDAKPTITTTDASEITTIDSTIAPISPGRLPNGCYDGSIPSIECCKMSIDKSARDLSIELLIGQNFDLDEINRHYHHSSSSEEKIYNKELLADPKNCHKYYKCALGKPLHLSCPYHTKWNLKSRKCVYASNTKCTDPESTTSITATTEAATSRIPTTTTKATTTISATWQLPDGCYEGLITAKECCSIEIGKGSMVAENFDLEENLKHHHHHSSEEQLNWNNETLADPKDCHKYFQCKSGKPVHLSCLSHHKWSNEFGKCIYSSSKKCTDSEFTTDMPTTIEETSATTTLPPVITTSKPWRLPDGCYDGSIKAKECCNIESEEADIQTLIEENFDLVENLRHHHSSGEQLNWNNETLADPKDCHKYYQCKSGKPVHLACSNNNKWSIEFGKCIYSNSKECRDPEITTNIIQTTEATTLSPIITTPKPFKLPDGCYDGSIKATQCCNMEIDSKVFTIMTLIGQSFDLEDYTRHHSSSSSSELNLNFNNETLADPKDCHKYYQCKSGKPVHLSCPKHNKWNTELGKCVYSDSDKCTDPDPTTTKPVMTTTEAEITTLTTETSKITTTPVFTTTAAPWRLPEGCYDGSIKAPNCCKIKINGTLDDSSSSSSSKERENISLKSLIAENYDLIKNSQYSGSKSSEEENNFTTESLADPKNCHKYFKCENGKPIHKSCPKHTKWNKELGQCVYAIYEKCSDPEPEPTTAPSLTTDAITTTEEVIITQTSLTTIEEITSAEANTTTTESSETVTTPYETSSTEQAITTSEKSTTTEKITSTEANPTTTESSETITTPYETSSTEQTITTSEKSTTTEDITSTEANTTTTESSETVTTPYETSSTEQAITTSEIITTTETATSEEITSTENTSSTEAPTTSEITTTTAAEITTEATSSTSISDGTTSIEAATSTERPVTSEETTITEAATTEEISATETTSASDDTTTTTIEAITSPGTTTTTKETSTTETTISTTEGSVTAFTTSTTEYPNNSTTETNTDPTPDPNGSCGTASYKCRHGIISAEECCKEVPYWEDTLLQNNDNCGTYFQCVHEVPQVRICPAGLYWNADVCRCEWKQLSTCNF